MDPPESGHAHEPFIIGASGLLQLISGSLALEASHAAVAAAAAWFINSFTATGAIITGWV